MFHLVVRCTRIYLNQNHFGQHNFTTTSAIVCAKQSPANHFKENPPDDRIQIGQILPQSLFFAFLRKKLNCPKDLASEICNKYSELSDKKLSMMNRNADFLLQSGVTTQLILDNPWMLTQINLKANLRILTEMKPNDINDIAPLLRVSSTKLEKIKKMASDEEKLVPYKNRIYYLNHMMKIEPSIISKALSTRLFIFELPFEKLNKNLNILLKYVAPEDILTDLWSLKYSPNVIETRLMQAKMGHKNKLRPWVTRCPEKTLLRSIEIASDNQKLLGDDLLVKYLSKQLQFDILTIEIMLRKYPRVRTVRVPKIKEILDYLLDEAGYTPTHIAQVPRIFCFSLKTTKERLKELESLNCRPASLNVLCETANEYRKFVESKMHRFKK